jgi:hypothetical protein
MEEPPSPDLEAEMARLPEEGQEGQVNRREVARSLKETERLWETEGDSESLWEQEHELLIQLHRAGDVGSVLKRARRAKRAKGAKGTPLDLASAALGLWVLERFDEAEDVLRIAMDRLPRNRYPWSLILRHLSWDRDPREAMDFIVASLDRVPWRAYSLVQLGTLCLDAAAKGLACGALEECHQHLEEANRYLGQASEGEDATEEITRTRERLMVLVETLKVRLTAAREARRAKEVEGEERVFLKEAEEFLEHEVREAADMSGVSLKGLPDSEMDLDELEKAAGMEDPERDEETVTVLEVTPTTRLSVRREGEGEGEED